MFLVAAFRVLKGTLVQPFCSVKAVYPVGEIAKDAPSREVKHCALEKLVSAWTCAFPAVSMTRRPLVAPHMSTGTYTVVEGRNPAGSVKAKALVPEPIAPWR